MKKTMCLIFIVLTSCTPVLASPPPAPASPPPIPMSSSFAYNQDCPHVCWLGINPGITTAEEALALLGSSNQIDQNSYVKHVGEIIVEWHTQHMGVNPIRVYLDIENGIVNGIRFSFGIYVEIREFIDLIGEPEEISVKQEQWVDGVNTDYFLYYTTKKIVMFVLIAGENGPDPSDSIDILDLNIEPGDPNPPQWMLEEEDLRQPWLGFGHLEEYLKNRPSPLE